MEKLPQDNADREHAFGNLAEVLDTLERHHPELTLSENDRKLVADLARAVRDRQIKATIPLIQILNRIGFFGDSGKPLDYATNRGTAYLLGLTNLAHDKGATLLATIVSDLQSKEWREGMRSELAKLLVDIRERKNEDTLSKRVRVGALAAWLLMQQPPDLPEEEVRRGEQKR